LRQLAEDNLNLEKLAYENDIHFIYWLNQFVPMCDRSRMAEKFFIANSWTQKSLPNRALILPTRRRQIRGGNIFQRLCEFPLRPRWIERSLRFIQLRIMPDRLKQLAAENNTNVVLNDGVLKFHDKDNRRYPIFHIRLLYPLVMFAT